MDYAYLLRAWEILGQNDIKWQELGDEVRVKRSPKSKLQVLATQLKKSFIGPVPQFLPNVLQLQTSMAERDAIEAILHYRWQEPDKVRLKIPDGTVMDLHPHSTIPASHNLSEYEILLKSPEGSTNWIRVSDLMGSCDYRSKLKGRIMLGDLIDTSSYTIPDRRTNSRERKLGALMGVSEISSTPSRVTETQEGRVRDVFLIKKVEVDTQIEGMKKAKIDMVINFLKSEKGKKYLEIRPNWRSFSNAFTAWSNGMGQNTMKKYRSVAKGKIASKKRKSDVDERQYSNVSMSLDWLE